MKIHTRWGHVTPLDHENPYKVHQEKPFHGPTGVTWHQEALKSLQGPPGGPWKGFSCYQITLINLYGMAFHAVIVFGLGFDFSFRFVSSMPKNRVIRRLYYSSLIFPTPTTWPFCRPADRHLHVRAWLSLLLISVTMKTTKWKWCEQSWSIRKKRKKKSTKKTTNWSKQHTLSKFI